MRPPRIGALTGAVVCTVAILAGTPSAGAASRTPLYQDPHASIAARVPAAPS